MVTIGTKENFIYLTKLDYTNTCDKVFSISKKNNSLSLAEESLPKPITTKSKMYVDEITNDIIPNMEKKDMVPLVVFYENKPAGYLMGQWEDWPNGKVLVIEGILVSNKHQGKGLAKNLLLKAIDIAKSNSECRGVYAEMDTTKFQASKLLLASGFNFGGAKLFIYSKEEPSKFSKEAIYFYYAI